MALLHDMNPNFRKSVNFGMPVAGVDPGGEDGSLVILHLDASMAFLEVYKHCRGWLDLKFERKTSRKGVVSQSSCVCAFIPLRQGLTLLKTATQSHAITARTDDETRLTFIVLFGYAGSDLDRLS